MEHQENFDEIVTEDVGIFEVPYEDPQARVPDPILVKGSGHITV